MATKRHVFHQLYYHFVWSVKDRDRRITQESKPALLQFIEDKCRELAGIPVEVNAEPDHVHLLVELLPRHAPADFVGQVKGAASHHVNHHLESSGHVQWQEGYGVITLRKGELKSAVEYVRDQKRKHREGKTSVVLETFEQMVD